MLIAIGRIIMVDCEQDDLSLPVTAGAYHTYRQQWTNTDRKKLVKDASKALREYHSRHNNIAYDPVDLDSYDYKAPDFHTDEYGNFADPIPDNMSLLYLGPGGPRLPFMDTMMSGLGEMMTRAVRNTQHMMKHTDMSDVGHNMMQTVGYTAEVSSSPFIFC